LNDGLIVSLLSVVPKNRSARCIGAASRLRLPRFAIRWLVRWFVRKYRVNLDECEGGVDDFESLAHFFVRPLLPGMRPIDADPLVIVSPVDGTAHTFGCIEAGQYTQAPGRPSSVEQLVGAELAQRFAGGCYAVLYLAPPDYHRVHAPLAGRIRALHYRPGMLWPVFAAATRKVDDLFGRNERLVFEIDTDIGMAALVMVGAFGVGRIANVVDDYRTNSDPQPEHRAVDPEVPVDKGAEIGRFELGSTVILLFGPDVVDWTMDAGQVLRLGQPIGRMKQG
jgi:phosphatidylserine decarboxylase